MDKLNKKILITASLLGALTIALGAFGAHGLKELVETRLISSFEVGVRYQMYHVFALMILGFASNISEKTKHWVFWFFIGGILLFSGSIYTLVFSNIIYFKTDFLGPITPLGGMLFIIGWLRLCYGFLKEK